jgi:hypothetical protein
MTDLKMACTKQAKTRSSFNPARSQYSNKVLSIEYLLFFRHFTINLIVKRDGIPLSAHFIVSCWPEDGPMLAETCHLNVNIIDFNTLLS